VDITWSSGLLAGVAPGNPLFVAVHYAAPPADCADNFKVYQVEPVNGFTVDVLSLDPETYLPDGSGYLYEPEQCPDIVRGASWAADVMTYDYGSDTLFFEFVAANFSASWTPTFSATGLDALQSATYEFTYDTPDTWTGATVWSPLVSGTTTLTTTETITTTGISVFVRVIVTNSTFENLAGQAVTLTLDGQNAESQWDVVNATCVDPGAADSDDTALQTIKARPTVISVPAGTFE